MAEQSHTQIFGNGENQYATREDFRKILDEDLNRLYQLSFLLTADHQKAERCFVASIEDCANENGVFREWARPWTKRVVVENAIRELKPRPSRSNSSLLPSLRNQQSSSPTGHFTTDALLRLEDFERFVFVLCVLESYRENDCTLLLGFPSSGSLDSCNTDIGQHRPGGFIYRFNSPISDLYSKSYPTHARSASPQSGLFRDLLDKLIE